MGEIPSIFKVAVSTIYAADIAVLLFRIRTCNARGELLRFAVLLASLALRLVVPASSPAGALLSIFIIWALGEFLIVISGSKRRPVWAAACAAFGCVTAFAFALDAGTVPREVFRAYSLALLGGFPVVMLDGIWRESHARVDGLFLAATVLLLLNEEARTIAAIFQAVIPFDAGAFLVAMVGAGAAYSIFQDGYLLSSGWRGWEARRTGHERLMRAAHQRIIQTENALALQDRLVVSGLLVMGAAHDFKNSLAQIKATADFALKAEAAEKREAALKLIVEHADAGAGAAVSFLERFSRAGREEPAPPDLAELISSFLCRARAAWRAEGLRFEADLSPVRVRVRWTEIEQVLLNLTGNAVDGFRRANQRVGERIVRISCSTREHVGLVEVSDTAGGMAPEAAARLFRVSPSHEGGTGLGLYLSQSLLERNGGTLSYVPLPGGSCFRMTLPLSEEEA